MALKLSPSSVLYTSESSRPPLDVSLFAHEFLFERVTVSDDFTLGDLFALLKKSGMLIQIFRRNFSEELLAEADLGPLAPPEDVGEVTLTHLELSPSWGRDTALGEYMTDIRFELSGIGTAPQVAPKPEDQNESEQDSTESAAGAGVERYSVSLTPIREMLHLPIRVKLDVKILEENMDSSKYMSIIEETKISSISLGQLLESVLWELSFHGTPQSREDLLQSLKSDVDALDAGELETIPADDFFNSDNQHEAAIRAMLHRPEGISAAALAERIYRVDDHLNMAAALQADFPGVSVKPPYDQMAAIQFRGVFRELRSAEWLKILKAS